MTAAVKRIADLLGGHPRMAAADQIDNGAGQGTGFGKPDFLIKPQAFAVELRNRGKRIPGSVVREAAEVAGLSQETPD